MGEEPKTSENEASVTVTVDRNKNAPVFRDAERYQKTILETLGEGNDVFRVTVEDRDRVVSNVIEDVGVVHKHPLKCDCQCSTTFAIYSITQ